MSLRGKKPEINLQEIGVWFPDSLPSLLTNSPKFDATDYVLNEAHIGADEVKLVLADIDWVKVQPPQEPTIPFGEWLLNRLDELRRKHKEREQIDLKRTALYMPLILDVQQVTLRRNRLFYSKDGSIILNCYNPDTGRTLLPPQWGLDIQAEYLRMKDENEFLRHLLTRKETTIENLMRAMRHWDMTINHLEALLTQAALLFSQSHAEKLQLRQYVAQLYSQLKSEKALREAMTTFKAEYFKVLNEEFPKVLNQIIVIMEVLIELGDRARSALIRQQAIAQNTIKKWKEDLQKKLDDLVTAVESMSVSVKKLQEERLLETEKTGAE